MKLAYALTFAVSGLIACGGEGMDPNGGPSTQQPGGPRIVSFAANTMKLVDEADTLTISAVLTDGDGVDDIIGGQLFDADSGIAYGSFATSAQEGAYSITLTWAQLTQPRSDLPGEWNLPVGVHVKAKFFDQAAHEATQTLSVELACGDDEGTVARVTKTGCKVGAMCGPMLPPNVGGGEGKPEGGGPPPPTVDCYLVPMGAPGDDSCAGWNGSSCSQCSNRSSGTSLACSAAAQTSYGAICSCN